MLRDRVRRVLVLAAHPDDAEVSVGGTIARLRQRGAEVVVVNFTTSEYSAEGAERRRQAAAEAQRILRHRLLWAEEGRHNQVEDIPEYRVVALVDGIVKAERPDAVLAPWEGDSHGDHVRLARAAVASSRRWDADLYAYCPGEFRTSCFQRFQPNVFVDIGPFVAQKLAAVRAYNRAGQSTRPLDEDALARISAYYGALSGLESAEGLLLLRARWPADADQAPL